MNGRVLEACANDIADRQRWVFTGPF